MSTSERVRTGQEARDPQCRPLEKPSPYRQDGRRLDFMQIWRYYLIWKCVQEETEDGQVYYYHEVSRVSRWDLPTEDVAEALNQRLQESQKQVEASVERRRAELEQERLREQEEQDEAEGLKVRDGSCVVDGA